MTEQQAQCAGLERLFEGAEHHVTLFRYSLTHSMAEVAIHDGFPFRRWPLYCRGVTRIEGVLSGGPWPLSVRRKGELWQLAFGPGQLEVTCEGFALGEFGVARSPEFTDAQS